MDEILISILVAVGVIAITVTFFVVEYFIKKNKKIKIDESFIDKLVNALGGISNIQAVSNEHGRVIFNLDDLDLIKADDLKQLTTTGVFITGNNVKMLFQYDSNIVKNTIKNLKEK